MQLILSGLTLVHSGPWREYVFSLQINLGTTVTMTSNGRQVAEGQRQPSQSAGQSDQLAAGQTPALQPNGTTHQQGQGGPRVIRITHQTMEPVVMMQMNIDGMCAPCHHGAWLLVQPGSHWLLWFAWNCQYPQYFNGSYRWCGEESVKVLHFSQTNEQFQLSADHLQRPQYRNEDRWKKKVIHWGKIVRA